MAKGGSGTLSKRNSKLESFLKLNLSQHIFERIRTYEACIVNFRKEKRAFKFAVLSDERIYLTENPPKTIHEDDAVHLGDVLAIDLVNEFPEFLNGEERENAQHIQVIYRQRAPQRSAATPEESPSRRRTVSADPRENGIARAATVPDLLVTRPGTATPRGDSLQGAQFKDGLPPPPGDGAKLHRSFDEAEMRALRDLQLLDSSGSSEDDRLSLSCPSPELRELSRTSSMSSIGSHGSSSSRSGRKNKVVTVETIRPLPQRPSGNRRSSEDRRLSSKMAGSTTNGRETSPQSPLATYRSLPSPDDLFSHQKKESFKFPPHENNNNLTILPSGRKLSLDSSSSTSGSVKSRASSKEKSSPELHLFILSQSSPFLKHLRSAWSNLLIKSTLLLDSQESGRCKTNASPSSKQLVHQYSQLKQEILDSNGSMEALFHLVQELTNAAEKYYTLKKLFWKSDDLITFIVSTLQMFLPKSSVDVITENDRHKRADELELAILMIESLGLMLHDTEVVPNRLVILRSKSGKIVMDLLHLLTCLPEIPQRWRPPSLEAHRLIQTDADVWESSTDAEVSKLVQELTNASTAVLYELILIAQQANWGGEESQYLHLGWLIQSLLSRRTVTFNFLERLLAQSMKLLLPSRDEVLSPAQAILLYQQFTVLQTLLVNSSVISVHVRKTYVEEFRYYVQSPHIVSKLPGHYPITSHTLRLIDDVLRHVLESEVSILKR